MSFKYDVERAVENGEFSERGEFVDKGFTWFYKLRMTDSSAILCAEEISVAKQRNRDVVAVKPGVRPIPQDLLVLPEVVNGHQVVEIEADAFRGAGSYLPWGDTRTYKWPPLPCFTEVRIPDSIAYIGPRSFWGCDKVERLSPIKAEVIACAAFSGCIKIQNIKFAEIGTRAIRMHAFSGCSGIRGCLLLPESLVTIEANAFSECVNITSVHIPDGMCEMIGDPFDGVCCDVSYPEALGISAARNKMWKMRTGNPMKRVLFRIANW